jgi:indolepyruvate ferredoxin oxidoreductase beta subunit
VLAEIRKIPRSRLIDAEDIARQAGNVRTANLVLIGAAMDLLPVSPNAIEKEIIELFSRKGESVIQANLKAFEAGRALYHG